MSSTNSPPIFSERYELVRHIARGGMAQVYLARDLLLDREVALKVLFPELSVDQSFVRRFRREAQAAASLAHPNIVSIFDWGQGESTYCIVMEYVDGRTLSAVVREAALDPHRAAAIGADVAAALDFAHGRGVIHRDVKPGNVLIDNSGQVKVADFGIARAVGAKEGLTQTGAVMGTATYFSPEQAQGFPVDAHSDVYSLGVVLYEIVAGRAPFTGENPVSIAYKHVRETPVPLRELKPSVPAAYEAVVAKAMAKNPDERYQSAGELQADLERFVAGQPVTAALPAPVVVPVASPTTVLPPTVVAPTVLPPTGLPPAVVTEERIDEVPPEDASHTGRYVALLIALLAVLGVLVFFLGRSLGWWGSAPSRVVPADIVSMPQAAATSELNRAGFHKINPTTAESSQVSQGDVITTRPAPGSKTRTSTTIELVVSSGPTQVKVPDVAGKSANEATNILTAAGFKVNPTPQASDTVASGTVISTMPPAGQLQGQGTVVTLLVSSGKTQVTIPSLEGQSPSVAGNKLGSLGLVATSASEASNSVPAGEVTRTSPQANTMVDAGSTVTVYVSTGPAQVTVPNLSGESQSQAAAKLSSAGLKSSFTTAAVTTSSQDGVVIAQSPGSGASVANGSTVTVTIGQFTAPPTAPSTNPPPSSTTPSSSSIPTSSIPR
ncbi:MAG: Stk1 family PASTA domain-containing Ser/Thr kinase [Actinomycetota bacterium]|nr:Stk1 family PASTA domain-containing Ser/Thr kinase [Actinomycetota bacterium]